MPEFGQTKWNWLRMPPSRAGPICVECSRPTSRRYESGDTSTTAVKPGSAQATVERVCPRVIRALERLAVARALGHRRAAMAADVHEGARFAVLRLRGDDRDPPGARGEEIPRLLDHPGVADVLPRAGEDPLLLELPDLAVGVPAPGIRHRGQRIRDEENEPAPCGLPTSTLSLSSTLDSHHASIA